MEVADLKSTNGTYVNGRKIGGPTLLSAADRVYVGDFLIGIDGGAGAVQGDVRRPTVSRPTSTAGGRAARGTGCRFRRRPRRRAAGSGRAPRSFRPRRATTRTTRVGGDDEEDELGLAARPPALGARADPPPPPPPPRASADAARQPRPRRERLGDEGLGSGTRRPRRDEPRSTTPGSVGLFAHTRAARTTTSEPRAPRRDRAGPARRRSRGRRAAVRDRRAVATAPMSTDVGGNAAGVRGAARRRRRHADPAHRARTPRWSIAAPGSRCTTTASAIRTRSPTRSGATPTRRIPPPAPDNPVVDVRLPDGTRVSAVFPPASPAGVVACDPPAGPARAHARRSRPGREARTSQTLLEALIAARRNVLLTGDAAALPPRSARSPRRSPPIAGWSPSAPRPRSRMGWTDLAPTADMAGLVRVAAALRPDHLVVGEADRDRSSASCVLVATRGQEGLIVGAARAVRRPRRSAAWPRWPRPGLGATPRRPRRWSRARSTSCVHVVATADGGARIVEIARAARDRRRARRRRRAVPLRRRRPKRDPGAGGCRDAASRPASARRSPRRAARCRRRSSPSDPQRRRRRGREPSRRRSSSISFRAALARLPAGLIRVMPPAPADDLARAEAALGPAAARRRTRRSCARSTAPICFTRACSSRASAPTAPLRARRRCRRISAGRAGVRRGAGGRPLRARRRRARAALRRRRGRARAGRIELRPLARRHGRARAGPVRPRRRVRPRRVRSVGPGGPPPIALRQAERALKADPGAADAEHARGLALARLGRRDGGARGVRAGDRARPGQPLALVRSRADGARPRTSQRARLPAFRRAAELERGPERRAPARLGGAGRRGAGDDERGGAARARRSRATRALVEVAPRARVEAGEDGDDQDARGREALAALLAAHRAGRQPRRPRRRRLPIVDVSEPAARPPPPARPRRPRPAAPPRSGGSRRGS